MPIIDGKGSEMKTDSQPSFLFWRVALFLGAAGATGHGFQLLLSPDRAAHEVQAYISFLGAMLLVSAAVIVEVLRSFLRKIDR